MTDSENEAFSESGNTIVSARGPNINIKPFSFCNDRAASMCLPRNFGHQRYAESVSDQRSIYFRKETSPMSTYSACDVSRPWNFQQYYNRMRPQQSLYHGRSGSPMSMRSIDSSASVATVADIIFAFKNHKFNTNDARAIKDAYNKWMKHRVRKRIEKRRNVRLLLKGSKSKIDYDSGEQGSDSSISSNDDSRSVKTTYSGYNRRFMTNGMNLLDSRKNNKDSCVILDKFQNSQQSSFNCLPTINNTIVNGKNTFNGSLVSKQSNSIPTLKERFNKSTFVLPSQRFNGTATSVNVFNAEKYRKNMSQDKRDNNEVRHPQNDRVNDIDSGEEIFSEVNHTVKDKNDLHNSENNVSEHKRHLSSDDDLRLPNKKKSRILSPIKNLQKRTDIPKIIDTNHTTNSDDNSQNFEFTKPMLPIRKSKLRMHEKLTSKSKEPLTGNNENNIFNITKPSTTTESNTFQEQNSYNMTQDDDIESLKSNDVCNRSSFIKRKLFTQKLDIAEKANTNNDNINSPQNVYEAFQKQKSKARKLVTNQSCLNRDIQEDNNYMELIHKIVPPDSINVTNQTLVNQTKQNSASKNDDDKWDVTSVISECNENDGSDTFTDEEIFKNKVNNVNKAYNKKINQKQDSKKHCNMESGKRFEKNNNSKCLLEKINNKCVGKQIGDKKNNMSNTNVKKAVVKNSAKSFWDTDIESDIECHVNSQKQIADNLLETTKIQFKPPDVHNVSEEPENVETDTSQSKNTSKDNNISVSTRSNVAKLNITTLSLRSHSTSKRRKCPNANVNHEPALKPQIKTTHTRRSRLGQKNTEPTKTLQTSNSNVRHQSNSRKLATPKTKVNNIKTPKRQNKKHNSSKNISQSNHQLNKTSTPKRGKNIQTPNITGRGRRKSNKENIKKS